MSVLQRFEKRLGGLVEGGFARVFRGRVEPVELAAALAREADTNKAVGAHSVLVPNVYDIDLGASDYTRLAPYRYTLADELADLLREHARDQGYSFVGAVAVELRESADLSTGAFRITSRVDADDPAEAPGRAHRYDDAAVSARPRPVPTAARPEEPEPAATAPEPARGELAPDDATPAGGADRTPPGAAGQPAWFGTAPADAAPGGVAAGAVAGAAAAGVRAGALPRGNVRAVRGPGGEHPGYSPDDGPDPAGPAQPTTVFPRVAPPAADHGRLELADGASTAITGRPQIVGRGNEADIQVPETSVSRRHARISVQSGRVVLEDLGSTNGTLVNGRRIDKKATLTDGDQITLGAATAIFRA